MNTELSRSRVHSLSLPREWVYSRIWPLLATALLCNSILRGIRTPGRWVYTEMLLNYDFGFSKRALVGAIISVMHVPALYSYDFCFWYCAVIFLANSVLLMEIVWRLCAHEDLRLKLVSLVFSSSLAVVVLAHTIGYGEQVGLLVALVTLRAKAFYMRTILASVLLPIGILVHETNFIVFFPVLMFSIAVDLRAHRERWRVIASMLVILAALACVACLTFTHVSAQSAMAMYHELQQKAQYPLRKDLFDWIGRPLGENLFLLSQWWRYPEFRDFLWIAVVTTLPSTLYILRSALDILSRNREPGLLRIAAVIAGLAPISLNLTGGDLNRWNSLSTITSFLVLFIVTLNLRVAQPMQAKSERSFVVPGVIIALTLGSTIPLFDGYIVQSFPFQEHVHDVTEMIEGGAPFPPRPELCVGTGCMTVIMPLEPSRSAVAVDERH